MNTAGSNCILQGSRDVLLADHIFEGLGTPFPGQYLVMSFSHVFPTSLIVSPIPLLYVNYGSGFKCPRKKRNHVQRSKKGRTAPTRHSYSTRIYVPAAASFRTWPGSVATRWVGPSPQHRATQKSACVKRLSGIVYHRKILRIQPEWIEKSISIW